MLVSRCVVLSDAPVGAEGDHLQFGRYVDPLIAIITDNSTQTPFTVGIFGAWGSGKSSLLQMIDQKLAAHHPDSAVRVHFNPWVYRHEPGSMLVPLLHTLQDSLVADRKKRFIDVAKRIGVALTTLSMGVLLGRVSQGSVTLDNIEDLAKSLSGASF